MELKAIELNIDQYPHELMPYLEDKKVFDSSCSDEARVIFIDTEEGYFLKMASKGSLKTEALMTKYFNDLKLAPEVLHYLVLDQDYLLTRKALGTDCTARYILDQPERLVDLLANTMQMLHSLDAKACPLKSHEYREKVAGLAADVLIHGDFCLPNILIDQWAFTSFVDLGDAGIGDRHVDIYWALWSLQYNLKTNQYKDRFLDAYGRHQLNEDILEAIARVEGSEEII